MECRNPKLTKVNCTPWPEAQFNFLKLQDSLKCSSLLHTKSLRSCKTHNKIQTKSLRADSFLLRLLFYEVSHATATYYNIQTHLNKHLEENNKPVEMKLDL